MISNLFHTFFFDPIFSFLVFIYGNIALERLGLAIIVLTVVIRIVLFPLFYKSSKNQALIQKIQPEVEDLKKKHKNNKEAQAKALMGLYKEHDLNPFSGIFALIVQLPIFLALFRIFQDSELILGTFSNPTFLGSVHLSEASIFLTILVAFLQYFQGKITFSQGKTTNNPSPMANIGKSMIYVGPVLSFVILINLPSALALYWGTSTLFSIGQQFIINKTIKDDKHRKQKQNSYRNGESSGADGVHQGQDKS